MTPQKASAESTLYELSVRTTSDFYRVVIDIIDYNPLTHIERVSKFCTRLNKGNGKSNVDLYIAYSQMPGMARIVKGSHSFTCTLHVHLLTKQTIPTFACQPKLVLIY